MAQPTFTQVRVALAATLATVANPAAPGSFLNVYAEYAEQITVPAAIIMPVQGTFLSYATMDGALDIRLRAVIAVAKADGSAGQVLLDPYLAVTGTSSVFACLAASNTLGGVVSFANLTEAAAYGPMTIGTIDYLCAHFIVNIGI